MVEDRLSSVIILPSLVYRPLAGYDVAMFNAFLFAAKRLILSFKYRLARRFLLPAKPLYLNFAATYKCNGRCLMCNNWKRYLENPSKVEEELTLKDLEKFFLENKDFLADLKHIGIAGGEPFLRPDLVEVVRLIREKLPKVSVGLQTNGLLPEVIEKNLKEIKKFYPEITLAVSLDGIGKTHDKIRGIKGAYQKVLQTIDKAQALEISEITAGMTVTKDNYQEIDAVRKLLGEKGVKLSFYPADEGEYYNTTSSRNLSGLRGVNESLIKALNKDRGDYFNDNLRRQLLGEKRTLPCYSGWTSLVIDPYGEVKPCVLRPESFGNIKKQSLEKILTGKIAKQIRQKIKKCTCWSICEVSTSAVVDPWDVVKWFLFYANKKKFLKKMLAKRLL